MSNIQKFQSVFDVTFPAEIADQVLGRMQLLYGEAFDKKYGDAEHQKLVFTTCTVLNGLSEQDLRRGLERMNTEKWCPSLPEFRSWCVHDGDWWTAEQAWAKALNFTADESEKITTLAKRALDEVQNILKTEGQKAAHRAFSDIYNDYLAKAKKAGRVQVMWVKPKAIAAPQEQNKTGTKPPADLQKQIQSIYRNAGKFENTQRVGGAA
ncbi:restriction endonuclease [Acinetobacter indicus]|uniref:restriction endonuclease n=1 Tax=Acinetobacter TaxID=469 RepID=UPI0012E2DF60|nr:MULTISPECIES: restriction endonuclease [Acinetobacter]